MRHAPCKNRSNDPSSRAVGGFGAVSAVTEVAMNHRAHNLMSNRADYVRVSDRRCPLCDGLLLRAPRRPVDRLRSVFKPVSRYRCYRHSCQWIGNLPRRTAAGQAAADARGGRVPVAFITCMTLAIGGVILVLVVGNSEPLAVQDAIGWSAGATPSTAVPMADNQAAAVPTMPTVARPTARGQASKSGEN